MDARAVSRRLKRPLAERARRLRSCPTHLREGKCLLGRLPTPTDIWPLRGTYPLSQPLGQRAGGGFPLRCQHATLEVVASPERCMKDLSRSIKLSDLAVLTISHLCLSALPRARKELLTALSLRFAKSATAAEVVWRTARRTQPTSRIACLRLPTVTDEIWTRRLHPNERVYILLLNTYGRKTGGRRWADYIWSAKFVPPVAAMGGALRLGE